VALAKRTGLTWVEEVTMIQPGGLGWSAPRAEEATVAFGGLDEMFALEGAS
jgi:hypothetical protein